MKVIRDFLPYDERKALETICRAHGIEDPRAIADLEKFCHWIHVSEEDKRRIARVPQAPFLISFLSSLGIHGTKATDT